MKAIIKLAGGDMRKCLNVMQACHLSYPVINEDSVYSCTGNPQPKVITHILDVLLNKNFQEAFNEIQKIQTDKGVSLVDIVKQVHTLVLHTSLPPSTLIFILDKLSDIEYRLAFGTSEKLQLGSLVGIFQLASKKIIDKHRAS